MDIKISRDFSRTPGARYPSEGNFSGQEFRRNILLPRLSEAIEKGDKLYIDLDGTAGLGTSFLEESFGGLIREDKINYDDIISTIKFISNEEPDYIDEIMSYIRDAYEKEKNV